MVCRVSVVLEFCLLVTTDPSAWFTALSFFFFFFICFALVISVKDTLKCLNLPRPHRHSLRNKGALPRTIFF